MGMQPGQNITAPNLMCVPSATVSVYIIALDLLAGAMCTTRPGADCRTRLSSVAMFAVKVHPPILPVDQWGEHATAWTAPEPSVKPLKDSSKLGGLRWRQAIFSNADRIKL
eukprot:2274203-Amphidinium_carterae.1